ncbi:MAG: DUF1553 domain-containing protein, partial [Planctomycetales bacterium]
NVPGSLASLTEDTPTDRLGLARWLVSSENPLTSRVIVNRYWQLFFGTGLVRTPEDFGTQGKRPTHPKLLDWLATQFQQTGWDVKRMHKLIVTSATYRQSSKVSPSLLERDPHNLLLGRGPRYRMPSWMLRDQALAISGLLVDKRGGPSVKPYQPANVWAEATFGFKKYVQGTGKDLYRRSLYTYWRRIIGPTMFFDTSRRQSCSVTSTRTNTPLHALTTLNDITFVEAARKIAERVISGNEDEPRARIAAAFQLATSRLPQSAELEILLNRYHAAHKQFEEDPTAALELLTIGDSPRDETLEDAELAAYAVVCSLILNLDETLTKE